MRWENIDIPIACFPLNTCAKNYSNPTSPARVTAKNVGVFFSRHSVYTDTQRALAVGLRYYMYFDVVADFITKEALQRSVTACRPIRHSVKKFN